MNNISNQTHYLKNYQAPNYFIEAIELRIELGDSETFVNAQLKIHKNINQLNKVPLHLDGEALMLKDIRINAKPLDPSEYQVTPTALIINNVPEKFFLETTVVIKPQENTTLSGLYQSKKHFCTQCEAHGFRRITYFIDRPDVMTLFTTTIIADKTRFPVLLSNGNVVKKGEVDSNRHWVTIHDPFKKPCYLFALVAGDLACVHDYFTSISNRTIALHMYVEKGNENKCEHAMHALKNAMAWDERVYGREYDLDNYIIVAVSDFNMGAMENKGLNIFNAKYILANPEIATDDDYKAIEAVVAHEYFHNWTGNRITCRDWFQLSLKEGLTVFREQQFIADRYPNPVSRIEDVYHFRATQFTEDAGPLAHPVQPDSYIEINNFYTATVYEKGSEVIRMIHTLLGGPGFKRGMDVYFSRHDGQAVTIEEFVHAMEEANQFDLRQFRLWYTQAGTPLLDVTTHYDAKANHYELTVQQSCPATPGQTEKKPLHIPFKIGLVDEDGHDISLQLATDPEPRGTTYLLSITKPIETFRFIHIKQKPIPSLLRDFSAPVKINHDYSLDELLFLLAHDSNGFARWEAGQSIMTRVILDCAAQPQQTHTLSPHIIAAYRQLLDTDKADLALKAKIFSLPNLTYLCEQVAHINIDALYQARVFVRNELATTLKETFVNHYQNFSTPCTYQLNEKYIAERQFKNTVLSMLMWTGDSAIYQQCFTQYQHANNMTDRLAALHSLSHHACEQREIALTDFYQQWRYEQLVVDKWFTLQALSELPNTLSIVKTLTQHPDFVLTNPNRVYALIRAFCANNLIRFHEKSGEGYQLLADYVIELNQINPQVAAQLLKSLTQWRKYDEHRRGLIQKQLERILHVPTLSKDVYEIASKFLVS